MPGDSRVRSSSSQRTRALDSHNGPAWTRGASGLRAPLHVRLPPFRRCRGGRPGLELRACRQRAPPRSRPPGPTRAAAAARPPPPARPGRPSRVRGASGQRARRRQHAHGGPRACAALRRPRGPLLAAAAPLRTGAPHRRAAAPPPSPAEPRGPSRMGERREARARPGRAGLGRPRSLAVCAPSPPRPPRGSEISRPLSATRDTLTLDFCSYF